jgi:predicted enzyme related to lactoylglutathione lyase
MLEQYRVHPTIPATDLDRARRFYADRLGLTPQRELPGGLEYECAGGTRFMLTRASGAASGQHTQMGFAVDDVESVVAALKACGVVFEEYDTPSLQTVNGIADTESMRAAWIKDSEGNILGLVQVLSCHAG